MDYANAWSKGGIMTLLEELRELRLEGFIKKEFKELVISTNAILRKNAKVCKSAEVYTRNSEVAQMLVDHYAEQGFTCHKMRAGIFDGIKISWE